MEAAARLAMAGLALPDVLGSHERFSLSIEVLLLAHFINIGSFLNVLF
jgi:hypothetical protein